jgi:hypothetical protein
MEVTLLVTLNQNNGLMDIAIGNIPSFHHTFSLDTMNQMDQNNGGC